MFRKILLIICMAFFVLCYVYPCVMLPFGSYSGEIGSGDSKVERTMTFDTKGKLKSKHLKMNVNISIKWMEEQL